MMKILNGKKNWDYKWTHATANLYKPDGKTINYTVHCVCDFEVRILSTKETKQW